MDAVVKKGPKRQLDEAYGHQPKADAGLQKKVDSLWFKPRTLRLPEEPALAPQTRPRAAKAPKKVEEYQRLLGRGPNTTLEKVLAAIAEVDKAEDARKTAINIGKLSAAAQAIGEIYTPDTREKFMLKLKAAKTPREYLGIVSLYARDAEEYVGMIERRYTPPATSEGFLKASSHAKERK